MMDESRMLAMQADRQAPSSSIVDKNYLAPVVGLSGGACAPSSISTRAFRTLTLAMSNKFTVEIYFLGQ